MSGEKDIKFGGTAIELGYNAGKKLVNMYIN